MTEREELEQDLIHEACGVLLAQPLLRVAAAQPGRVPILPTDSDYERRGVGVDEAVRALAWDGANE